MSLPRRIPSLLLGALSLAVPAAAAAAPAPGPAIEVRGEVVAAHARWARGGRDIVTETVVRTADGEVHLRQLGGTVDGIGMRVSHTPPLLVRGDRVRLSAGAARDLSGRASLTVRAVDQLERAGLSIAPQGGVASFVRTSNETGAELYWAANCVFVAYAAEGTAHIGGDREFAAMDQVFARWRADTESCSYLSFELDGRVEGEVGLDGVNLVKFRDTEWCRPATDDDPAECYSPDAAGLTTLYFVDDASSDDNGKIYDADIELNGVTFAISLDGDSEGASNCHADLTNTMTHEAGHLVGLDHTCWSGLGLQPVDANGQPVQPCGGPLSDEAIYATMYAFQDCGETSKASPEADDIAGVCGSYPLAADPGFCEQPDRAGDDGGCCVVSGRRAGVPTTLPLVLLAAAALVVLRRRGTGSPSLSQRIRRRSGW